MAGRVELSGESHSTEMVVPCQAAYWDYAPNTGPAGAGGFVFCPRRNGIIDTGSVTRQRTAQREHTAPGSPLLADGTRAHYLCPILPDSLYCSNGVQRARCCSCSTRAKYGLSDVVCEIVAVHEADLKKGGTTVSGLSVAVVRLNAVLPDSRCCQSEIPDVPKRK